MLPGSLARASHAPEGSANVANNKANLNQSTKTKHMNKLFNRNNINLCTSYFGTRKTWRVTLYRQKVCTRPCFAPVCLFSPFSNMNFSIRRRVQLYIHFLQCLSHTILLCHVIYFFIDLNMTLLPLTAVVRFSHLCFYLCLIRYIRFPLFIVSYIQ